MFSAKCSSVALLVAASVAVAAIEPAAPDLLLHASGEKSAAAHAHFLSARMLEDAGQMREALGHYLEALKADSANAELLEKTAGIAADYGSVDQALGILRDAVKSPAAKAELYAVFIRFCAMHPGENNAQIKVANELVEDALKRFPQDASAYETAVGFHLMQGQRAEAVRVMEKAAKQDVKDAEFWLRVGRVSEDVWPLADADFRADHLKKVNAFIARALPYATAQNNEDATLQVADYYLLSNQIALSASVCEGMVKRNGSLDARKRLVRLYEALERNEDSFKALEELVKAFPQEVEHRKILANQYLQMREIDKAVAQLEAALQAGGGGLKDYLQLSNLMRLTKQSEKFLEFTRRAGKLFPGEPRVMYFQALAHIQLKQYADAAKLFDRAGTLAETMCPEILDDGFYFSHGVALERDGNYAEAEKKFEKSMGLTPVDELARAAGTMNYLGYMWLERGEHLDKAEELIRKAIELDPDNAAYQDSMGWLHFHTGKFEEALKELLKAESMMKDVEPEDAEIFDHIAQTYDKLNQRAKAEEYWRRVLDLKPSDEKLILRVEKSLGLEKERPPTKDSPEPSVK